MSTTTPTTRPPARSTESRLRRLTRIAGIDHTKTDVTAIDRTFDIVFDAAGNLREKSACKLLADGGSFVTTRSRRDETLMELMDVRNLLVPGALTAVVDREYDLDDVADAHAHVEGGRKRSNVLVHVISKENR